MYVRNVFVYFFAKIYRLPMMIHYYLSLEVIVLLRPIGMMPIPIFNKGSAILPWDPKLKLNAAVLSSTCQEKILMLTITRVMDGMMIMCMIWEHTRRKTLDQEISWSTCALMTMEMEMGILEKLD